MRDQNLTDKLIENIYACLLGESSWHDFLQLYGQMSPGCWAVLHGADLRDNQADIGLVSGRSLAEIAAYPAYHDDNPWASAHLRAPQGQVNVVERNVPAELLMRTAYYNDFLRPIGTRSCIGMNIHREGGRVLTLSLMTPGAEDGTLLALENEISQLAPHLARASRFYRRTRFSAQTSELGGNLFDALHVGVIVVGHGRRIRSSSDLAQRMFGAEIRTDPLGRLQIADPVAQSMLDGMLSHHYDGPKSQSVIVGAMRISMVTMQVERERSLFEGPGVCMMVEATAAAGRFFDHDTFVRTHGLTPSEARVLSGLISGKTVAEIAREAGRAQETVRTQLKSLYAKTGVHRSVELLRLAIGMKS